jgi:hypothetical protein
MAVRRSGNILADVTGEDRGDSPGLREALPTVAIAPRRKLDERPLVRPVEHRFDWLFLCARYVLLQEVQVLCGR